MKSGFKSNKKFRYGSVSVILTVLVIAAVIIFNVIFSALANKYLWYIDLTSEQLYTLTDDCSELLEKQFKELDKSRKESDKNNVTTNNDKNNKNNEIINKNETKVSQASGEEIKSIWLEIRQSFKDVNSVASSLADIADEKNKNEKIDELNKQIVKINKKIDKINSEIEKLNEKIDDKNNTAGLNKGDAGYTNKLDFLENIQTLTRVNGEMKVKIIFCEDPDNLKNNNTQRFVYETALQIQKKFSDIISIEYIDIWRNPSAVQPYKTSSYSNIYSTDVIVTSGTEFRVLSINSFYVFSEGEKEPWAYNGEKKLAAAILAVTKAESPIAALTFNHGEKTSYDLYYLLEDAGYKVVLLDLLNEEIPEDCRLILSCGPNQDFFGYDKNNPDATNFKKSEIQKLDDYLDKSNSFMAFFNPNTPKLPNLEEYLEEWGVVIDRHTEENNKFEYNYMISDSSQSLTTDGFTIFGQYSENGLGNSVTLDMLQANNPPKVVFKNSTSISYSPSYTLTHEENDDKLGTKELDYGLYSSNGITRKIYNIFTSSDKAVAFANGKQIKSASVSDLFSLMTITQETRTLSDSNYTSTNDPSNVAVCASTDFYSENFLQSSVYGNSDVLMTLFGMLSREVVIVPLSLKPFASTDISTITVNQTTAWTVCLAVIPALAVFVTGLVVIIRRKYA